MQWEQIGWQETTLSNSAHNWNPVTYIIVDYHFRRQFPEKIADPLYIFTIDVHVMYNLAVPYQMLLNNSILKFNIAIH